MSGFLRATRHTLRGPRGPARQPATMSSQIRYQFLHSRDTQLVRFDGPTLSLELLKREIAAQNSLYAQGVDLVITDTSNAAFPPGSQVHKNTSVLVRSRAPLGAAIVVGAAEAGLAGGGGGGGGGGIPGLGGGGGAPLRLVTCAAH